MESIFFGNVFFAGGSVGHGHRDVEASFLLSRERKRKMRIEGQRSFLVEFAEGRYNAGEGVCSEGDGWDGGAYPLRRF